MFALLLVALFLTKYNYWTLLVAGLLCASSARRGAWSPPLWRCPRLRVVGAWLLLQLRHPLTYLLVPSLALMLYVQFGGHIALTLGHRPVSITTVQFPAELFFTILALRVLPWWWRSGRHAVRRLPVFPREVVRWLVYPLAVWFLWPKRLGVFIWYVTFTQHGRAGDFSPWLGNFSYYRTTLASNYFANHACLVLALALIGVALLGWRRWRPGAGTVFVCLAVAALLTNYHSANRTRFLHSWMSLAWVAAGAGAALGAGRIADTWALAHRNKPATPGVRLGGAGLMLGVVAGLAVLQGPALVSRGFAEEGGPHVEQPSLLGVADAVVPSLARATSRPCSPTRPSNSCSTGASQRSAATCIACGFRPANSWRPRPASTWTPGSAHGRPT